MKYKIKQKGSTLCMTATYEEGTLTALEGIQHLAKLWATWAINAPVPIEEAGITAAIEQYDGVLEYEAVQLDRADKKIAMFCAVYKKHFGITYQPHGRDRAAVARARMDDELLELYFTNKEWWGKQPKSIHNYAKNFNALQQLMAEKQDKAASSPHPNEYQRDYEKKLSGAALSEYWQHLRRLGYRAKKSKTGKIIDWVKPAAVMIILMLLLSGCMTEKRALRYIAERPHLIERKADTVQLVDTIQLTDTLIVPGWTDSWDWSFEGADTVYLFDNSKSEGSISIDTVVKLRLRVRTDTLYRIDTLLVPGRQIETTKVVTKEIAPDWMAWSKRGVIWGLILLIVLIGLKLLRPWLK